MEINRSVCVLKTTLNNIEKNLKSKFKEIVEKNRETAEFIKDIVLDSRLQSYFENKDDDQLRKLHLLLLINTDLGITSELESDCNVGHVVEVIPQLSTRLYFAMTYRYNLFKYMNEVLELGPIVMVLKLLDIFNDEVKFLVDQDRFQMVNQVLQTITILLMKTDSDFTVKKLFEHFQILMIYFKKPEAEDEDDERRTDEQIANEGYKFMNLICLFHQMTRIVYGQPWMREALPLYDIVIAFDPTKWYVQSELKEKSVVIQECYESVFFKCRELLTELDLDMFLTWHEVDVNGRTLQNIIGEEVFHLCRTLEMKQRSHSLPSNTEELISMLKSVSVKPDTVDETMYDSDAAYLEDLILRNDIFDKAFLELVDRFLQKYTYFKSDVAITFVRKLFDEKRRPNIDPMYVKKIIALTLQGLDSKDICILLNEFIIKFGPNHFMVEKDNDFRTPIKQIASLYIKDDESEEQEEDFVRQKERQVLKDVSASGFHATSTDLKIIIREGCLERNDAFVIIKIIEKLKPLCLYKLGPDYSGRSHTILVETLKKFLLNDFKDLPAAEKEHLSKLLAAFSADELMDSDDFLSYCLLPLLYINSDSEWLFLADLLKLFKDFFMKINCQTSLCWAIILAQMAQILEGSRWSVTFFSTERMLSCERVIEAIDVLIKARPKEETASTKHWMESQLSAYSFLTRSYFVKIYPTLVFSSVECQLAALIHEPPESYDDLIENCSGYENAYVIKVGQLLLCCTQKEIQRIIHNYGQNDHYRLCFILNLISDSISFISNAAWEYLHVHSESAESIPKCLGHLINNFLSALQKTNDTYKIRDNGVNYIKYVSRIIAVLKLFPEYLVQTYKFNVIKFLMEELPILRETTLDFDSVVRQLFVGLYLL